VDKDKRCERWEKGEDGPLTKRATSIRLAPG
jgi:hypothetical protein